MKIPFNHHPSSRHLDPKPYRARRAGSNSMAGSYGMNDTGLRAQGGPNVRAAHQMQRIPNPGDFLANLN